MSGDVTVVVLAAGASRRLGTPKQLLAWEGTTLIAHAARTALDAALGPVVVVLGSEAARCREALHGVGVTIAEHPGWTEGMGGSIAAGVRAAAERSGCAAIIVMTCDQPGVTAAHLDALVGTWRRHGADAVGSRYAGTVGTPALFARVLFAELSALSGDRGARTVLDPSRHAVGDVPCPGCADDIDTDADYQALQARHSGRRPGPHPSAP